MTANEGRIVAIGLLTQSDLDVLGQGFRRVYPVDNSIDFTELLKAIDKADASNVPVDNEPDRVTAGSG